MCIHIHKRPGAREGRCMSLDLGTEECIIGPREEEGRGKEVQEGRVRER